MKKTLLVAIVLTAITIQPKFIFAQNISFESLMAKTDCDDFVCYQDFVTQKGFSYLWTRQREYGTYYTFNSDIFTANVKGMQICNTTVIGFLTTGSVTVSMRTSDKTYYQSLFNAMKLKKFTSYETENPDDKTVRTWYKSPAYPKISILFSVEIISKDGIDWTSYDFTIRRDQ